ncbi:glycosyltransferase [Clostridium ganghwense]|uniref:Glycosyltransferase n=1 Tax=Clostridium ganghwense TaxID=312089 RepID=A0ABT4CN46_9CLOT|nr:glycosyltransferase [Clostridium ganghwense]MCY6370493.1 glycosyltransferase [Clostridium ganghwense]
MRVLHIITGSDNGGGGAHVLNICKYSKKFNNILGCIGEGYLYEKAKKQEINTVMFKNKINNKEIIDYINKNKIDIVNFHGAKAFLIHRVLKNKIKASTLASVHSDYRYDFLNNKIKHFLFTPLSKYGLKSFNNYMCISNYIKDVLEENNFRGEKCVVNNGIDLDNINITKTKEEIRKEYGILQNYFVFVNVARMHPIKNHNGLINAFYKLRDEFEDIKLVLVGDGELQDKLQKKVLELKMEKDIIFTGFVENPINIMNASEISILTSFNEGGSPPIVILESGIANVPAISSKVGDIEKNFNDKTVFVINDNSEEEIYKKMKEAYLKKDVLNIMGKELYKEVIDNYDMEKFCNTYYSFYKKVIKTNKFKNGV